MDQQNSPTIADQFKQLPEELQQLILSPELPRKISLVAKKYQLNQEQERLLANEVGLILLVLDSTSNLPQNISDSLGVTLADAASISMDIDNYIFNEVTDYLVHDVTNNKSDQSPATVSIPIQSTPAPALESEPVPTPHLTINVQPQPWAPLRATAPPGEGAHANESTEKHDILNHIENPPRTLIKKHTDQYVIEHDIVTDPTKLIDNKVDNVPKLQEIYLD